MLTKFFLTGAVLCWAGAGDWLGRAEGWASLGAGGWAGLGLAGLGWVGGQP